MIDFKALADNSIDVIVRCSLDGIATYASPSVTRLLGIAPDEMIGRSHRDFVLPEDKPALEKTTADHRAGRSDGIATFRMARADGSIVWVEGCGRLIEDPANGKLDLVIILRDISERKALEERLTLLALTGGARPLAGDRKPAGESSSKQIERRQLRGRVPRRAN